MLPDEIMRTYKTWAVVGASVNEERYGYKIFKMLKDKGYNVYPICPNYEEIDGVKAYKSILDLPEKPEVVNFVVNPKIGIEVVKQCETLGIQYIWLQPGTVSDELLELAKESGIEAIQACALVVGNYK
jgi:predicted CoA-binding protein